MIHSFWWLEINYETNLNADTRCWTQSMISFCVLFLSFRCFPERRGPTRLILKGHGSLLFNKWLVDGFDITRSMTVSRSHFETHWRSDLGIYFSSLQGKQLNGCLVTIMSPFLMFLDFRKGNGFGAYLMVCAIAYMRMRDDLLVQSSHNVIVLLLSKTPRVSNGSGNACCIYQ